MSETRKQRRQYEKYLKRVDPIKYEDYKSKNIERMKEKKLADQNERDAD